MKVEEYPSVPVVAQSNQMLLRCYQKLLSMLNILIKEADTLIVAGTSLTVEPANSLVKLFNGTHLVIINNTKTLYDHLADLVIHDNLKDVFSKLR